MKAAADDLVARVERLEQELRELSDRRAIVDCLHRYSRGLDRHDGAVLASAYHEDSVDRHGEKYFMHGPAEFVSWVDGVLASEWDAHLHFLDLNNIEIEGDVAHTDCYVLFTQRRRDGEGIDIGGGRYIDRLERRGEWRIAAREVVIEWTGRIGSLDFTGVADHPEGSWDRTDPSYMRPFDVQAPHE